MRACSFLSVSRKWSHKAARLGISVMSQLLIAFPNIELSTISTTSGIKFITKYVVLIILVCLFVLIKFVIFIRNAYVVIWQN